MLAAGAEASLKATLSCASSWVLSCCWYSSTCLEAGLLARREGRTAAAAFEALYPSCTVSKSVAPDSLGRLVAGCVLSAMQIGAGAIISTLVK